MNRCTPSNAAASTRNRAKPDRIIRSIITAKANPTAASAAFRIIPTPARTLRISKNKEYARAGDAKTSGFVLTFSRPLRGHYQPIRSRSISFRFENNSTAGDRRQNARFDDLVRVDRENVV